MSFFSLLVHIFYKFVETVTVLIEFQPCFNNLLLFHSDILVQFDGLLMLSIDCHLCVEHSSNILNVLLHAFSRGILLSIPKDVFQKVTRCGREVSDRNQLFIAVKRVRESQKLISWLRMIIFKLESLAFMLVCLQRVITVFLNFSNGLRIISSRKPKLFSCLLLNGLQLFLLII